MDPTDSHGIIENATASSAGGSPDGEDSRRGAEAQRGIGRIGRIGNAETSNLLSATA
ncbi:MAG: hypothetical protein ACOX52_16555 [Verrucomicrobiota bacterium]